jgi:hypothetical protein
MTETPEQRRRRLRWLTLGEIIAVIAVAISALGLWKSWQSDDQPATVVVEQRQPIALTLRGKAEDEGRTLEIAPVEQTHALQSLSIKMPGGTSAISIGSDGDLAASSVEDAMGKNADRDKATHRLRVHIQADYVEAGAARHASHDYLLTYRWEGGSLFGGRSLRLVSLSRA